MTKKYNNNKNNTKKYYNEKVNLYFLLILIALESKSNIKNWHLSLTSKMLFSHILVNIIYIIHNIYNK